jgi:hypothetical protein
MSNPSRGDGWIDQTIMHDPDNGQFGNCMQACIASYLHIELEEVPHFHHDGCAADVFWDRVEDWLDEHNRLLTYAKQGNMFSIASGPSVRGTTHCVIMCDDQLIWDPHPSRAGLVSETHRFYLLHKPVDK